MLTETIGVCRGTQFVKDADKDSDPTFGLTEIDHEEQNAGYQAAYSRLAASEAAPVDPVAWVSDPKEYLGQELVRLSKNDPRVKSLLTLSDGAITGTFLKALASAGLVI